MARLGLAWVLLAALSVLLIFRVDLHSDLLFLDNLMTDLVRQGGHWSDWKLTPAPAYFPDMLLYAIAYFILPNPVWRILFVSMAQALLLAWVCNWLAGRIKLDLSHPARCVIVLLVATVVLVSAHSNMWLFFNSTNNHFAALLFSLLSTGWVLRYLERPSVAHALLIITGGALAKASTIVFTISFTLPLLCTLGISLVVLRKNRLMRSRILQVAAMLIASQIVAAALEELLVCHSALTGRVAIVDGLGVGVPRSLSGGNKCCFLG